MGTSNIIGLCFGAMLITLLGVGIYEASTSEPVKERVFKACINLTELPPQQNEINTCVFFAEILHAANKRGF